MNFYELEKSAKTGTSIETCVEKKKKDILTELENCLWTNIK